jgi:hypothetical protein
VDRQVLESGFFEGWHNALGKQPDILESQLLRHALKMKRSGKSREPGFLAPAPDRVDATLRITGDDKSSRYLRGNIVIAQFAMRSTAA